MDVPANTNLAEYLSTNIRVLCMIVPIGKGALEERGETFMKTWAKRCTKFIFFTDEKSKSIFAIQFPIKTN
jgi:hypothetical protein